MTELTENEQMKKQITKLKSEKRLLIANYNKEKVLRESLEKKVKKLEKQSKRGNRNTKKSISKAIGTQTFSSLKKAMGTQTNHIPSNETYFQCRKVVEDLVKESLKCEQGIQCNFIADQDPDEKNIMVRNSKLNDEYYMMKYFKHKVYKNTRVAYINENYDMRFRREMLGVLDMDDDFNYINIKGKLMHSLMFTFYNAERKLFNINYKINKDKSKDHLSISNDRKAIKAVKKRLINLQEEYTLSITYEKQTRSKKYFRTINKPGISMERIKASKKYNKERLPKSVKAKLQKDQTDIITRDVFVYTISLNNIVICTHELDTDLPIKVMQSNANFNFKFE